MAKRKKNKKPGSVPNKKTTGKNKASGKSSPSDRTKKELKLEVPPSLKALCILSFMGFIYCLVMDTQDYFAYSSIEELKESADQSGWEKLETRLARFEKNDIDISDAGIEKLALASIYRTIIDVLAMVGTALMYFRIRRGFYIYGAFQLLYVIVPFAMFGIGAMVVYDKLVLLPPLIYLILFTTQYKYLNR
ncbi:hypothetical protein [Parvicella tangerina]|uniref:Uncharacterized protein n=1 Tax=Parvicella tangerina TaxID=2829795 RepID=A0A916JNA3_9FLAO|nr:hypothetical protein [Parvicella tangerina]CAG5083616.1 hypothetical protein CRYO30217_02245 [Parvicella tangerina]